MNEVTKRFSSDSRRGASTCIEKMSTSVDAFSMSNFGKEGGNVKGNKKSTVG